MLGPFKREKRNKTILLTHVKKQCNMKRSKSTDLFAHFSLSITKPLFSLLLVGGRLIILINLVLDLRDLRKVVIANVAG
jgi:hypothetical protein